MQDISVLNKEIDLNCTENFRLSIQISLNGFSFGINHDAQKEFYVLKYCPFENNRAESLIDNIKLVISMNPLLSKKYKKTKIIIDSEKKTIVPQEFFSKESIGELFSLTNTIDSDEALYYNSLNENIVIFTISNELEQFLKHHFKDCHITSSVIPLINYGVSYNDDYTSIIINKASNTYFDLIICKDNKLILANTYKYHQDIDIAYYTLNSLKMLNLSNCKTIYNGIFDQDSKALTILKNQIPLSEELSIVNNAKELRKNNINTHFANLINSDLCE